METNKPSGDKPDFKGNLSVAGWINTDKDGKSYLSISIASRVRMYPVKDNSDDLAAEEVPIEEIFY